MWICLAHHYEAIKLHSSKLEQENVQLRKEMIEQEKTARKLLQGAK